MYHDCLKGSKTGRIIHAPCHKCDVVSLSFDDLRQRHFNRWAPVAKDAVMMFHEENTDMYAVEVPEDRLHDYDSSKVDSEKAQAAKIANYWKREKYDPDDWYVKTTDFNIKVTRYSDEGDAFKVSATGIVRADNPKDACRKVYHAASMRGVQWVDALYKDYMKTGDMTFWDTYGVGACRNHYLYVLPNGLYYVDVLVDHDQCRFNFRKLPQNFEGVK